MRSERAYPPEGQFVTVDGHRVHVLEIGEGPDLVLIHGASGNLRDFTHGLTEQLAKHFRVLVFDRPGLGYSDQADTTGATITQQAEILCRAAAQLGADAPIVLGQSYGGSVALAWAAGHPEHISALITLAAPSHPWTTPLSRYYRIVSHPILGLLAAPVLAAFVTEKRVERELSAIFAPQDAPDGYAAHIGAGLTLRRSTLRANALQRANLLHQIRDLSPKFSSISVPTEILHGDADTTVSLHIHSGPLAKAIRGANLTVLSGIGHMPHHTAQDAVISAIFRAANRAGLK